MRPLLLFIAAASALSGAGFICCPDRTRKLFRQGFSDRDIRVMASLPLTMGAVLVLGGLVDRALFHLYILLGSMAFLKGIYLLCAPPEQVRTVLAWWREEATTTTLILWGFFYLVLAGYIGCSALFHRG